MIVTRLFQLKTEYTRANIEREGREDRKFEKKKNQKKNVRKVRDIRY